MLDQAAQRQHTRWGALRGLLVGQVADGVAQEVAVFA